MSRLEGTPLYRAVCTINAAGVEDIVRGDLSARDSKGRSAVHLAVRHGMLWRIIASEVEYDPDVQDNEGNTPLHLAAHRNRSGLVRALLDHGANSVVRNNTGKRPLDVTKTRKQCADDPEERKNRDDIRSMFYKKETLVKAATKT